MQNGMYNKPKEYNKPHKFFEKFLDNDLQKLSSFLEKKYSEIEDAKVPGVSKMYEKGEEHWVDSGSLSTVKWNEYNVFQFYSDEVYNVYKGVKDTVIEACEYYGIDFDAQKYMIQGWFNINDRKVGKLDWHDHGGPWAPFFHGYYCIKAEPSSTFYMLENDPSRVVENKNIDNRLIVSEMGHPHAMGDWDWDGKRITLAYDIVPLRYVSQWAPEQHYFPLY